MPALQTAYAQRLSPAFEGMVADSTPYDIQTFNVETAAGIGFGKVCVRGTADDQVRVSEATRAFAGISCSSHIQPAELWPQYASIEVLTRGKIWVIASVAVAPGDLVYYVPATGVLTNVSAGNTLIAGAIWNSTAIIGALAELYIK